MKDVLNVKALFGLVSGFSSFVSGILTTIHILTPIVGFASVVLGFLGAYYSYRQHRKDYLQKEK